MFFYFNTDFHASCISGTTWLVRANELASGPPMSPYGRRVYRRTGRHVGRQRYQGTVPVPRLWGLLSRCTLGFDYMISPLFPNCFRFIQFNENYDDCCPENISTIIYEFHFYATPKLRYNYVRFDGRHIGILASGYIQHCSHSCVGKLDLEIIGVAVGISLLSHIGAEI